MGYSPEEEIQEAVPVAAKQKKKSIPSTKKRCIICSSFIKINKRYKELEVMQLQAMNNLCDICSITCDDVDSNDDYSSGFDPEMQLELELLRNPSGRVLPKIYDYEDEPEFNSRESD